MPLPTELLLTVGGYGAEYFLSDYYCPECGNQTMYYFGNQVVAYACVKCHSHWQIRVNEKPSQFDDVLFGRVSVGEPDKDVFPIWSEL